MNLRKIPDRTRAAMFYFFYLAAIGATAPFLYLVYRQRGLSPAEIGIVIAVAHVMNFVSAPFWGAANDIQRRRGRLSLLPITCLGAGPMILLFLAVHGLAPMIWVVILWGFFAGAIVSLADASTLMMLGQKRDEYGRIRMWGSLGSVCASLAVGLLGNRLGLEILFPTYTLFLLLCAGLAFSFPQANLETKPLAIRNAFRLLQDSRITFFFFSVFFLAVGYMGWRSNFSLYLEDMGASPGMIGAFFAISSGLEIPVIAISAQWLGRWGARASLLLSFFVFALLWLGCSLIQRPELALPLALVHGFSYGIYDVSGVVYTGQVAPVGYANLAQGVYGGINRGLGSILGSLAGGFLFQNIGGANTYRLSALLGLLALFCLGLVSITKKSRFEFADKT